MAVTNGEKQASWRERHLKNENGNKLRAQFIFDASTKAQLKRIACHKGSSVTSLIKEWAASAERRITHQLSGKAAKAVLRWRIDESSPMSTVISVTRTTRCANERTGHIAIHRAFGPPDFP